MVVTLRDNTRAALLSSLIFISLHFKYPCVLCGVVWCGVVSTEQSAVVFKLSDLVRQSNTDMINGLLATPEMPSISVSQAGLMFSPVYSI